MSPTGEPAPNRRARAEATQRRRILQLSSRLSATLGSDFFQSLVKNLCEALSVECAYVGELTGTAHDRVSSLAVILDGHPSPAFEKPIAGTACGQVLSDGVYACAKEVLRIFPDDAHLREIAAEGYAGIRLSDRSGQPVGVLALASKTPLLDANLAKSVLETFSPRVAARSRFFGRSLLWPATPPLWRWSSDWMMTTPTAMRRRTGSGTSPEFGFSSAPA